MNLRVRLARVSASSVSTPRLRLLEVEAGSATATGSAAANEAGSATLNGSPTVSGPANVAGSATLSAYEWYETRVRSREAG